MIDFSLQHILQDAPYDPKIEATVLAIIVDNRNPKLQAITEDFEATAEALTNKPE